MSHVQVTRASGLKVSGPQTEGMLRLAAFTDISDQICGNCKASIKKKNLYQQYRVIVMLTTFH